MSEINIFNDIIKVKSIVIASSGSNKGLLYSENNGKTLKIMDIHGIHGEIMMIL